jgi:Flp pilus assembly pilin Flp
MSFFSKIRKLANEFQDESGATLVEYGVALLVVIVVGATSIGLLATAVGDAIGETASAF